jgi:hypothetical protein
MVTDSAILEFVRHTEGGPEFILIVVYRIFHRYLVIHTGGKNQVIG